jgi:hypothetical protein
VTVAVEAEMTGIPGREYFSLLLRPPAAGPVRDDGGTRPGMTVLIPTHTATELDRLRSLRLCVQGVLAAAGTLPVAFVVVDSGLSGPDARAVGELLRASGRTHRIVRAGQPAGSRTTAAHARNTGLDMLSREPAVSPLRRPRLLFLDDDSAPAAPALALLNAALDRCDRAVAACPRVVPVPDLAAWRHHPAAEAGGPSGAQSPRRLAGAIDGHGYDLLSVTSHGSLVTGRMVGLLVRQEAVLRWIRSHGPLFYPGTPYGSTEDMLAMAMLSRLGELWSVPDAVVVDEARRTPGATRTQQFRWGYDHAWLVRVLAGSGALAPGVHVLDWQPTSGWWYRRLDWPGHTGFLINPTELRLVHRMLRAIAADASAAVDLFGDQAAQLGAGTSRLGRVLSRCYRDDAPQRRPRPDLPPLSPRGWASLRDGLDALLGHVAGNVMGSLDHGGTGRLPRFFLYGARQPAGAAVPAPQVQPRNTPRSLT